MATDELRAKFEVVAKGYGYCVDRYPMDGYWTGAYIRENVRELWAFWQAAHASRDAEVEAMRKDAERYRLLRSCSGYQAPFCVTQNIGHDWIISRREELDEAIDAAMREVE